MRRRPCLLILFILVIVLLAGCQYDTSVPVGQVEIALRPYERARLGEVLAAFGGEQGMKFDSSESSLRSQGNRKVTTFTLNRDDGISVVAVDAIREGGFTISVHSKEPDSSWRPVFDSLQAALEAEWPHGLVKSAVEARDAEQGSE